MKTEFKPVAMPCTKEQFEEMRPTLEKGGCEVSGIDDFSKYKYLTNNFNSIDMQLGSVDKDMATKRGRALIPYNPTEFYKACGIELPKYDLSKLTQDHIQELIKEPNIHEMFVRIGVVKNEIPFGSWVVNELFKNELIKYNENEAYGISAHGDWIVDNSGLNPNRDKNNRIATTEEVEKRLTEYAESIGVKEGAIIKNPINGLKGIVCSGFKMFFDRDGDFVINKVKDHKDNYFHDGLGDYTLLSAKGQWCEVVKEETYIKIPLSEIKATPNYYELGRLVKNIADNY